MRTFQEQSEEDEDFVDGIPDDLFGQAEAAAKKRPKGWEGVPAEVMPRKVMELPEMDLTEQSPAGMDPGELEQFSPPQAAMRPARVSPGAPPPRPLADDGSSRLQGLLEKLRATRSQDKEENRSQQLSEDLYRAGTRQQLRPLQKVDNTKNVLEEYGLEQQQKSEAKKAAFGDPMSEQNVRARQVLAGLPVGKKLQQSMGAGFDSITLEQLPWMEKLLAMGPKEAAAPDPYKVQLGEESKARVANMTEDDAETERLAEILGDVTGRDLKGLGRRGLELIAKSFEGDKRLKAQVDAAGAKRAAAAAGKEAKGAKDEAMMTVPGMERDPSVASAPDQVAKIRTAKGQLGAAEGVLDHLEELYKQHGMEVLPGPARDAMLGDLRDLQLKLKSDAFYQLGVLTGPDLDLLEAVTGNPTALKGFSQDFITKLRTLRNNIRNGFSERSAAFGYRFPKGGKSGAPKAEGKVVELAGKKYRETGDPAAPLEEID